jgi:hypothetical protein
MGLFTPKYPDGAAPPKRESRSERKDRETQEATADWRRRTDNAIKDAERASKERDARFWDDYERRNGPGSVRH